MNNNELEILFSNLQIKSDEYSKIKELIKIIKNDEEIKNVDKIKILKHIDNIFFYNNKNKDINENNLENEQKDKYENIEKNEKNLCKKCSKLKFKNNEYCYKHCQDENIIPKNIKRKDYNEYIKSKK